MAVVNVDLSEYDAIRKRNSELEEQVKELKELNESLKGGSKVILRKETVVEYYEIEENPYRQIRGIGGLGEICEPRNVRRTIESSESFVNFEDVRLKVEQAMQDEVNRSIHDRDCERQSYADAKNKLDNEYNLKKADLEKKYKNKAEDLEEEYHRKECDFESEKLRILNLLPNIRKLAEELHDDLNNRFFKPKHAIELANSIINTTTKKL
jgi:uncharacterized protein YgiM (DUF1202 family)